jgi:hypothetical protein
MDKNERIRRIIIAKMTRTAERAVFDDYEIVIDEEFFNVDFTIEADISKGLSATWSENTGGAPAVPAGVENEKVIVQGISWYNNATQSHVEIPKGDPIWVQVEDKIKDIIINDPKFQKAIEEKILGKE